MIKLVESIAEKCRSNATFADLVEDLTEEEKQWSLNNPIEFKSIIQKKYCKAKVHDEPAS